MPPLFLFYPLKVLTRDRNNIPAPASASPAFSSTLRLSCRTLLAPHLNSRLRVAVLHTCQVQHYSDASMCSHDDIKERSLQLHMPKMGNHSRAKLIANATQTCIPLSIPQYSSSTLRHLTLSSAVFPLQSSFYSFPVCLSASLNRGMNPHLVIKWAPTPRSRLAALHTSSTSNDAVNTHRHAAQDFTALLRFPA